MSADVGRHDLQTSDLISRSTAAASLGGGASTRGRIVCRTAARRLRWGHVDPLTNRMALPGSLSEWFRLVEINCPALRTEIKIHFQRGIIHPGDVHACRQPEDGCRAEWLALIPIPDVGVRIPGLRELVAFGIERNRNEISPGRCDKTPLPVFSHCRGPVARRVEGRGGARREHGLRRRGRSLRNLRGNHEGDEQCKHDQSTTSPGLRPHVNPSDGRVIVTISIR